jgi:hypothetical protein
MGEREPSLVQFPHISQSTFWISASAINNQRKSETEILDSTIALGCHSVHTFARVHGFVMPAWGAGLAQSDLSKVS